MAIENTLEVRLLHAAKTLSEWNQVENAPKAGEVCLEKQSTTPPITYKIKIGDNSTHYANLPYFGTVVTASGNAQVVEFYTYPDNYSDISLRNVTVMRIYELNLSYSSGSGSGETAINLSVDTTTFKEIRPGSNISFTSSNSGALLTIAANMDFSSLDVTEYAQVEWDSTNNQINIYGIKEVDGKISRGASFKSLKVSSPLTISNTNNIITFGIQNATTQQKGAVRLLDTYTSSNASDNTFATTNAAITSAIENLDSTATTSNTDNSKDVIVTVTESNGIVSSTKKTVTEGDKITISTPTTGADAGKMIISHEESNTVVTDNSSNKNERETNIITDVTIDDYGHVTAYTKDKSTNLIAADIRASVTKTDDTTWNYRETGGEISIGEDIARVSKLKGNTIVWNQMITGVCNSNEGLTVSYSNGIFTITGTATSTWISNIFIINPKWTENHKYLVVPIQVGGTVSTNVTFYNGYNSSTASSLSTLRVYTPNGGYNSYIGIGCGSSAVFDNLQIRLSCFDLTKMFGSDDAIKAALGVSTLEGQDLVTAATNFEKLFHNTYYPYCEGRLVNLGGYGVKWNQNIENGDFSDGTSGWSGITSVSSGIATKIVTATGSSTSGPITQIKQYTINHKYLFIVTVKSNNSATNILLSPTGTASDGSTQYTYYGDWTTIRYIWTAVEREGSKLVIRGKNDLDPNTDINFSVKNVMCFDLTEMFGPGSEPTLEEFEAMFPDDYYEYNEGTEMNIFDAADGENKLGLKSTGFNQWDEELEQYSYDQSTGEKQQSGATVRSVNKITVIPSASYYFRAGIQITFRLFLYYSNGGYKGTVTHPSGSVYQVPSDVHYIAFQIASQIYGTTYNHDICINISSSRNGEYEPYKKDTLDLSWVKDIKYIPSGSTEEQQLFPQGLLSAGSVYDEVGENYAIKRVGAVDLGTLTWEYRDLQFRASYGLLDMNRTANTIIPTYENNGTAYTTEDKHYYIGASNIIIYDSSYTSANDFMSAVSGVMLYYELATPVVVYFDEKKKLNYFVDDHGTEQQLPVNSSSVITSPFVGTFEYKSNFKDAVIDLIDKVNAYKNPVKGKNDTNQTVDKFAIYDSAETVKSSEYAISDSETPFIGEGTEFILPTAKQVVDYVTTVLSSTLTYKGVLLGLHKGSDTKQFYIDEVIDALNPHVLIPSVGDMYVVSTQFSVSNNEGLPYGNIADGTYNAGDFFIWNNGDSTASPAIPAHWDIVSGTTSVAPNNPTLKPDNGQTAHEYTVAAVDGTPIKVKVPGLYTNPNDVAKKVVTGISFDNSDYLTIQKTDLSTSDLTDKPALGNVFIGTGNGTSPEWNYLSIEKLDEINNILSSSESGTLKTGFLSRKSSGTTPATYSWEFANPLTSVSQLNIKTTSNDPLFSFDPSSQSNTDLRITSVDSSDASNANMYSNTNKAGIKITNGSNTTTQRISFSAIADDANVTIILDGNFS